MIFHQRLMRRLNPVNTGSQKYAAEMGRMQKEISDPVVT